MRGPDTDEVFTGSFPKLYEACLVPLMFEPYAVGFANRLASRSVTPSGNCGALSWQNVAPFIAANHKNLGNFGPELLLAKACTPDLVVVQTTKEVHHE